MAKRKTDTVREPLQAHGIRLAEDEPLLPFSIADGLLAHVTVTGDRDTIEVTTPLTEQVLGETPSCSEDDVIAAVERARKGQQQWEATELEERATILMRLHDLVLERQEEVLDLIQLESGKVRAHAYEEVMDAAIVAAYYARTGAKHLADQDREGAIPVLTDTIEVRHPKGVVGFIAPWNYPLSMGITDAIPALMAGNAVVVKPAQTTPFTLLWAVDLAIEAGIPADVLQVVTGRGSVVGEAIIAHTDFVQFTGSTAVGRSVAASAGQRLIGCGLELGGKNPMIVCEDVDLDLAVAGAISGCFSSAGQLCISVERLYVERTIISDFTRKFVDAVNDLQLSIELEYGGQMGSLQSRSQLETVSRHVKDAKKKGATVLAGGQQRTDVGPLVYEPTVLTGVDDSMEVYSEETFGPVVSIYPFDTIEEAVEKANDSVYGLNAMVWTRDTEKGRHIARRLKCGTVTVNDSYAAVWGSVDAPMGGFKDSGLGRRHGAAGILKYTESQSIAVQRGFPVGSLPLLGQEATATVMSSTLNALHSARQPIRNLSRRLRSHRD